ncbi:hypothetical protein BBG47_27720 [Paenibacillus sp. KS1]|uniref:hypothetical protein n=1 Tax=Paenibacillus sp. KS1 TaxID=1849249 RepID=UPI0008064BDF|nr:hypothetical protein [Paenibacillus sp. KS1]OBY76340.1 hypothetical protein BBG47_27720 [Paenibacillus sp. KS1]
MKNCWNYRVIKKKWSEELYSYEVCEVYYENDRPTSWIWGKNVLSGGNEEDLKSNLNFVLKAFEKPVLEIIGDDESLREVKSDED